MKSLAAVSIGFLTFAQGCSLGTDVPREELKSLDDALSVGDFDTTVAQLAKLPYLPWTYTVDGCYARALYYSMLLATKNVGTNHLYSVARNGLRLGGVWRWHVAPMVTKDGYPNSVYVLDPVYDKTRALTSVEWIAYQDYPDTSDPNYPFLHVHSGNSYGEQDYVATPLDNIAYPNAELFREPTLATMPSFHVSDIDDACYTMHRYIDRETGTTNAERAIKHTDLAGETVRLLRELDLKTKVDHDFAYVSSSCTGYATTASPLDGPGVASDFPEGRLGPTSSPR